MIKQKIALYMILAVIMLGLPLSSGWAQDSFEEMMRLHENYDWDGLMQRGENLKQLEQSGQLGRLVFSESGFNVTQRYAAGGGLSEASISAKTSSGAATSTNLQAGYPPLTVLEVEVTLTVAKGMYKVEFKNNGETTLALEAANGSEAEGKGLATVDAQGNLPYEVTAADAEDMAMTVKVKLP